MLNDTFHYREGRLYCDDVSVSAVAQQVGTPVYIYSLKRALGNLRRIQAAFPAAHIHYSAKANANLALLRALIGGGAGIDAVSGGEIYRALLAGAAPENIVFAGVGKTQAELDYALRQQVGWINAENVGELELLDRLVQQHGFAAPRVALRLNPDITASTHPYIATGHGGAKFGLPVELVQHLLAHPDHYPHLRIEGIHIHIGSQLHDTDATRRAVQTALDLIAPYPHIRTVNIGGGLPVAYAAGEQVPTVEDFTAALAPLLANYTILLEPGRSIIADAGILAISVLYIKQQAGQTFLITDGSMAELIRPALYQAHHEIVPIVHPHLAQPARRFAPPVDQNSFAPPSPDPIGAARYGVDYLPETEAIQIVGPVCETADVLGRNLSLPETWVGDQLALLDAGAYGLAMASNYNQRPRPPEVVISADGAAWRIARRRETWEDLARCETE